MKRFFLFFGLSLLLTLSVNGQEEHQERVSWSELPDLQGYHVVFHKVDATCYNNGRIEFAIVNDVTGAPVDLQTINDLRLSDFLISHRGVVLDTTLHRTPVTYTYPWTSVPMETGTFQIGFECVHTFSNGNMIIVEDSTQLTVDLNYTEPTIAALTVTSPDGVNLGNIASLDCDSTGRTQVRIRGGRHPFKIHVVNHNDPTDTLRTVDIGGYQHSGMDSTLADYQYYYTFENMPGGVWDYYLTDGCQYELPRVTQQVQVISVPVLDHIGVYASSGNIADSNVIKIRAYLDAPSPYYMQMFTPYMQYRFIVPGLQEGVSNQWVSFPNTTSNQVTLFDTVLRADMYCDLWEKDITFQLRLNENGICPPYEMSDTFHLYKPERQKFISEINYVVDSVWDAGNCGGSTIYRHVDEYTLRYDRNEPNHLNPYEDHDYLRYHFTYPIVYEYRDGSNTVIKTDTIYSNIAEKSRLFASDFPGRTVPFMENVAIKLTDANGCVLYNITRRMNFEQSQQTSNSPQWRITKEDPVCCSELRTINLFEEYGASNANYDGLTISLISSPDNVYNFTARYEGSNHTWVVQKERVDNWAIITPAASGKSISISDYCLPSGTYTFRISNAPCMPETTVSVWLRGIVSADIVEEPEHHIANDCSDQYIKYTKGRIAKVTTYRNEGDNTHEIQSHSLLPTLFRVVSGPVGGYDPHDNVAYHIGDSIRISVPTDSANPYIIKIYPDVNSQDICGDYAFYDTVYYEGATVKFDFAMALLCNEESTEGSVYVKARNGNPPFHYQLYNKPNQTGMMIGDVSIDSSEIATFHHVTMSTDVPLSCRVEDACGSAFSFNFYPQTLADLQKTWFDGGLTAITTCEGSTIQVHALRLGSIFQYEWYKDDATEPFSVSSDPNLFIPRGADTAVYHVKIYETGCAEFIEDSVTLYPKQSPWVTIAPIDPVCPWQDVEVSFTPTAIVGDSVSFSIVYENGTAVQIRDYRVPSGQVVTDIYNTGSPAKIYPTMVLDDECGYPVADPGDTVYIAISDHIINPCQIITRDDTVCYLDDAKLSAYCTEEASVEEPITIRWYSDFSMTDLLQEDVITSTQGESSHYLYSLNERTYRFVSVEKEGWCPSVSNTTNNTLNMTDNDVTTVRCTDSYQFFDDGGVESDYSTGDVTSHLFVSADEGTQLTIHFESMYLSNTSHLLVFSGSEPRFDALLCELNTYSDIPEIIVSPTDTLMVYFIPGEEASSGWTSIVQPAPGVAVGDIYKQSYTLFRDTVCQSQTRGYYDRYSFTQGDQALQNQLDAAVKVSRIYLFERHLKDMNECDSTVALSLWVMPPPFTQHDTVILSLDTPLVWNGLSCSTTGQYGVFYQPYGDGCDSADYLNLIVLEVDTSTNEICIGERTDMGVYVKTPDMKYFRPRPAVGDVLCTDGDILRPDSFLVSGKVPMGVVFYIEPNDPTHMRGRAVALFDAYDGEIGWARNGISQFVHSGTDITKEGGTYSHQKAMRDMDGYYNTTVIQQTALLAGGGDFKENAPAAYYCWYYDHLLRGAGPNHKYWYMPSLGELNILYANRAVVNETLSLLASRGYAAILGDYYYKDNYSDTKYWSSTESELNAYCISSRGQINRNDSKVVGVKWPHYVRAVRIFPN